MAVSVHVAQAHPRGVLVRLSPSTAWMAGYGSKELSCEELADYISVLAQAPAS